MNRHTRYGLRLDPAATGNSGGGGGGGGGAAAALSAEQIGGLIKHPAFVALIAATIEPLQKSLADLSTQVKTIVEDDSARAISGEAGKGKKGDAPAALSSEQIQKMIADGVAGALKSRDDASAASAANRTAAQQHLEKNAPKLKGNAFLQALLEKETTEEGRKAVLDNFQGAVKATGATLPDIGASAEKEGGAAPDAASAEKKALEHVAELAKARN